MKLDHQGPVIADALEQTEVKEANERGAGAWIEFTPDGCAKVTRTISRELSWPAEPRGDRVGHAECAEDSEPERFNESMVEQARMLDLTTAFRSMRPTTRCARMPSIARCRRTAWCRPHSRRPARGHRFGISYPAAPSRPSPCRPYQLNRRCRGMLRQRSRITAEVLVGAACRRSISRHGPKPGKYAETVVPAI